MKNLANLIVSDEIYDLIERRARAAGRSPAEEAADMLARSAVAEQKESDLLEDIRRGHEEMARKGIFVTEADILSAIEWGRE